MRPSARIISIYLNLYKVRTWRMEMLNLTLTSGDGVKIGEDVQIVFESTPSIGRIKISIDAPRDKNIARMPVEKKRKGNIVIVKQ